MEESALGFQVVYLQHSLTRLSEALACLVICNEILRNNESLFSAMTTFRSSLQAKRDAHTEVYVSRISIVFILSFITTQP